MESKIFIFSKLITLLIFSVWLPYNSSAITSSVQNGNFDQASTWDNGVPTCGDTIYISTGDIVTVDNTYDLTLCGTPMFLVIEGILQFKNGPKIKLPCGSGVLVKVGGMILGGGGKGGQNTIEICGTVVWVRSDGDIINPTSFGYPFSEKIISVASTNWSAASTWDCVCDPQFYHDVIVDVPHTVSITIGTEINSLNINGILDAFGLTGTIDINGNWNNINSFIAGSSLVNFKGGVAQQIVGNTNFYSITADNTAGVSIISGNINLSRTLTLTAGNFSTNNNLTLLSDANGTANIASITGGSITGNITMQRHMAAGPSSWRYLTSAVSGTTIADLNDDFTTSGFIGSNFPPSPSNPNPWVSVYTYDESVPGIIDSGFVAATNTTNSIAVGQGFWSYIWDTQSYTVDVVGPPNVGNINLPVSYTNNGTPTEDGWNMVGNPYPSTIDWDSPGISKTNINGAFYIWNASLQQFASYISPFGTNGGTNMIPSSQAFWVQSNGAGPNLQLTESCKANNDATFLKQNSTSPLRIKAQNNSGSDELIINFESNASNGFDNNFDAKRLKTSNGLPEISSFINGIDYSINQMNSQEIDIPIKILTGVSDTHNISIKNASLFSNNCIILEDLFTNTSYDLSVVDSFSAFIYDTTQTARFLLHVGAPVDLTTIDISCFGNNDGKIIFSKNSSSPFDIIWNDNLNNPLATNTNVIVADSLSSISGGTYYIETTDLLCGNRIDTVIINEPSQITAQFSSGLDTVYLSAGAIVNFTNLSTNAITYLWDFGNLNSSTSISPTHNYNQAGNHLVLLKSYQTPNCFEIATKNITVVDDITSIQNLDPNNKPKVWINNNNLLITGNNISNIKVGNLLGQLLFTSQNSNEERQVFDLNQLNSQVLIVTTFSNNKVSSNKVVFVNTSD
jgi:hypothetical protein